MGTPFDCEPFGPARPKGDREEAWSQADDDGTAGTAVPKGAEGCQVAACSDAA